MTHILQPCDVGVFSTFAQKVAQAVEEWWDFYLFAASMQAREFIDLVDRIHKVAFTPRNILAAFRRASIIPFNKRRILQDDSIQWQTRNQPYRRELRSLPHRLPAPTPLMTLASKIVPVPTFDPAAINPAAPTPLGLLQETLAAAETNAEVARQALAAAEEHETRATLLAKELEEVQRSKALRAADKRVLTKKRTGTSIRELRKARDMRVAKDSRSRAPTRTVRQRPGSPPRSPPQRLPLGATDENRPPRRRLRKGI